MRVDGLDSTGRGCSWRWRPRAWRSVSSGTFPGTSALGATRFGRRHIWLFNSVVYSLAASVDGWRCDALSLATAEERAAAVKILGVRAPLGAWVAMWGGLAMLTSAPFDDWWHNAYGLDVKIVSPPHTLLGLGMLGISLGALLLGLAHQNRVRDAAGDWLFVDIGGIFLTLGGVFLMEFSDAESAARGDLLRSVRGDDCHPAGDPGSCGAQAPTERGTTHTGT